MITPFIRGSGENRLQRARTPLIRNLAGDGISPDPIFSENCSDEYPELPAILLTGSQDGTAKNRVEVMVDGSGDGHSIALFPDDEVYFSYERGASNNESEFNAVILALDQLPRDGRARIRTDSQVVVWNLLPSTRTKQPSFLRKTAQIQDQVLGKELSVEITWIPRQQNRADRFLKRYIASLCGAEGHEPLYNRVRRLEAENNRLRAKLRRAYRLLEERGQVLSEFPVRQGFAVVPEEPVGSAGRLE